MLGTRCISPFTSEQVLQDTVGSEVLSDLINQRLKAQLANMTGYSVVFGAPTFVFDKILFWGCDLICTNF